MKDSKLTKDWEAQRFEEIKSYFDKHRTLEYPDICHLINQVGLMRRIIKLQEFLDKQEELKLEKTAQQKADEAYQQIQRTQELNQKLKDIGVSASMNVCDCPDRASHENSDCRGKY